MLAGLEVFILGWYASQVPIVCVFELLVYSRNQKYRETCWLSSLGVEAVAGAPLTSAITLAPVLLENLDVSILQPRLYVFYNSV